MILLADRLKQARAFLTLNQKEFSSASGVGYSTYQKYEMGMSLPGAEAMEGFSKLKININWLLTGLGDMMVDMESAPSMSSARKPYAWHSEDTGVSTATEPAHAPYGFVLVPKYDVSASMGNGSVIHSEQIVDHLAFREEWVRTELNASPKSLVLISAIGDSMEPTLRAGDLLLIDRSGEGIKQDAIYAFATNGELRVKRMQLKIDGSVVVKSDNAQYEAETLTADQVVALRIVGRVVWSGRRM